MQACYDNTIADKAAALQCKQVVQVLRHDMTTSPLVMLEHCIASNDMPVPSLNSVHDYISQAKIQSPWHVWI